MTAIPIEVGTTGDPTVSFFCNSHLRDWWVYLLIVAFTKRNLPTLIFGEICSRKFRITRAWVVYRNDFDQRSTVKGIYASALLCWLALLRDGKLQMHDQYHPIERCRFDHPEARLLIAEQIWWLIWWNALAVFVLVLLLLQQRWSHSIVSLLRLQTPLPEHLSGTRVDDVIPHWPSPAERWKCLFTSYICLELLEAVLAWCGFKWRNQGNSCYRHASMTKVGV